MNALYMKYFISLLCFAIFWIDLTVSSHSVSASYKFTLNVVYNYPARQPDSISLRGDGLGLSWDKGITLTKSSTTLWSTVLSVPTGAPSLLQVKPLVRDSTWSIGSNFYIDLTTPFSSVTLYPWFYSTAGKYSIVGDIYSPQLNNTRSIIVYTPPSYYENLAKVYDNVLIMHDGQNLFNTSTSYAGAWHCDLTVNQEVVSGRMDEVVIVGVYNTPDRLDEYTYSYDPCYDTTIRGDCIGGGGKGDLYLDFLIENVIPFLTKKGLRVDTSSRENIGILGSSLGGLISCYAGFTRSNVWAKSGCMSSSFWWNSEDFNNIILTSYPSPNPKQETFYLDSGTCCPEPNGDDRVQTATVRDSLKGLGWVLNSTLFYYLDQGADHSEYYWGTRFYIPMRDLYPITSVAPDS